MRCLFAFILLCAPGLAAAQDSVRSRAVVDLSLDVAEVADAAKSGQHADKATATGKPQFIRSPFWNQKGKAVILDSAGKQYLRVPDSPDVDRPQGATVSLFFLSLHPLSDGGFRGIFAKRGGNADSRTNYGINFQPSGDAFQLYIHDGTGFKVAGYSVKEAVGFSRLVHLTATFEVADAPGPDADTDADDLRIRLFINGRIIKPKNSSAGFVTGNDAWLTNLDVPKLVNDVPLTIGSSFDGNELTSGVYDEFLLFDRALTPGDVQKLFVELTGATAEQIAQREQKQKTQAAARPAISTILPRGLQTGGTTRVTISGSMLTDASVFLGERVADVKVVESSASRIVADVAVPASTRPGFYPLRVHSSAGVSAPAVVAVDRLPEQTAATTPDKPAALPAAFSGVISGSQQAQLWFAGRKDQRIVADVETRRLGSGVDPVVEIRNERGTPLTIEWRKHELHGDTRAEAVLPADGKYYVDLHDIAYKAPGNSPYRVRVGDLAVVDRFLPSGTTEQLVLAAVGTGIKPDTKVSARPGLAAAEVVLDSIPPVDGPLPPILDDATIEVREQTGDKPQEVEATFTGAANDAVVAVNGTISEPRGTDSFVLKVTEGMKLYCLLKSRSIGSPLDGTLRVFNGDQQIAAKNSGGLANDVALEVVVPKGAKTLRVQIGDFAKGGGPSHAYRLLLSRSGRADFRIAAQAGAVEIPRNGSAVLRLSVTRRGAGFVWPGPIRLSIEGDPGLEITPNELPAERGNRDVFVVLTRSEPAPDQIVPVSIVAETTTGASVRRVVRVPTATQVVVNDFTGSLTTATAPPADATINVAGVPPVLFRGLEARVPLQISNLSGKQPGTIRFRVLSTERPRDKKPRIRALPNQFVADGQSTIDLRLAVPLDQVDPIVDFVVVGELVENPFSPVPQATVYSAPLRLSVQNAVRVTATPASQNLTIGGKATVAGVVNRRLGFGDPVRVSLAGLPKGYSAKPVVVDSGKRRFSIAVNLPKGVKPGEIKPQLVVQSTSGAAILPNQAITLKVVAAK